METTLKVFGREFRVTGTRECPHGGGTVYELTGKRGAVYTTMRHATRKELMFLCGPLYAMKRTVWFTDAGGTLRVVE